MSDRFEKLIRGSAPEMPDPGEYRRLNRVPLRERLHEMDQPKRRHSLVVATACLALMVLFSGQLNQLGGYDFNLELVGTEEFLGEKKNIYKNHFSGATWTGNRTLEEIREMEQSYQAHEGELSKLTRLAYQDEECWNLFRAITQEDGSVKNMVAQKPPEFGCDEMPNQEHFYPTYFPDMMARSKLRPPDEISHVLVFDVTFELKTWKFTYPEYGEVTYSKGFPLE